MAQYLKFPIGHPSIWDHKNFRDSWVSKREWTEYMNHQIEEGDPETKTFVQYPSKTFVIFVPIHIYGRPHPSGPHLVSFFLEVKGEVVSILFEKFYRHGFIPPETYEDILDGKIPWADYLSEVNNEMIDEILNHQRDKGPNVFLPLVNSYGELMITVAQFFAAVTSK